MSLSLDLIFVPQGPEYQAVKRAQLPIPIVAIPAGLTAVEATLNRWRSQQQYSCAKRVLVMGLGGSLIPQ
ncbi:hypothetical protein E1H12_22285, partial [Geitlerinema sp. P-1104]|nr:hypothetical protein [Geitlerinema sp. P-1104]